MRATRLTVKQLENWDPCSGLAVVDHEEMGDRGGSGGDVVTIEVADGGTAVAPVRSSDDDAGRRFDRVAEIV